ncbi:MAG: hypothetical protein HY075_16095, partial [Deltaproteobacteria bacterium]|nr:hypothetical protein [Deltaproteobacteria bacterium]
MSTRRTFYLVVNAFVVLAALAAAASRAPSSPDWSQTCKKLSPDETDLFKTIAADDTIVGESMLRIRELAALFGTDKLEKGPITMELYVSAEHGINWALLESFSKVVLADCQMVREGDDPSVRLTRKNNPKEYRRAKRLCGPADDARKWIDFDSDVEVNLRREISLRRGMVDAQTRLPVAPDKAADSCLASKKIERIEDAVENLFTCLNAFQLNLLEYDFNARHYVVDRTGKLVPKVLSTPLQECVRGYIEEQRKQASKPEKPNGKPAPAPQPAPKPRPQPAPPAPKKNDPVPPTKKPASPNVTARSPSPNGGPSHPPSIPPPPPCLPGDPKSGGACATDSCVRQLADDAHGGYVKLPPTFTSSDALDDYARHKGEYVYALTKHQAKLLAQGFVVAAYQRRWKIPEAYNKNLREFSAACGDAGIRASLDEAMAPELIDETITDGAYSSKFADQTRMAETKGPMMVANIDRILALRKLVALLKWDFGAKEVSTLKAPGWLEYLPILHYFADGELAISFGNVGQYQCNMFALMQGNDFVPRTSDLLTKADAAILEWWNDEEFRKLAFCSPSGRCEYPGAFQRYLSETSKDTFKIADQLKRDLAAARVRGDAKEIERLESLYSTVSVKLRYWCGMREEAAESLIGLEQQIVTLYPALAHAEDNHGKPGAPLFERLRGFVTTSEGKAAIADAEAERTLPVMQDELKKYLKHICDDWTKGTSESAFMAVLGKDFLEGFEPPGGDRSRFYGCEFGHDADEWRKLKELPGFLVKVGLTTLDALFIYSAASGGISRLFTPRGLIIGGVTGAAFTGANYGVSYLLARYNDQAWDDYHLGSAAAVRGGIDSYTNALAAI